MEESDGYGLFNADMNVRIHITYKAIHWMNMGSVDGSNLKWFNLYLLITIIILTAVLV